MPARWHCWMAAICGSTTRRRKRSVRISPQQRLIGQAAIGDVLTVNFACDYAGTLLGDETIADAERQPRTAGTRPEAATGTAVYSRVEYWVEHGSFHPVKAKFYSDSGRLLKILYYRGFKEQLGAVRPSEGVIIDAVDSSLVTTVAVRRSAVPGHPGGLVPAGLSAAAAGGMTELNLPLPLPEGVGGRGAYNHRR